MNQNGRRVFPIFLLLFNLYCTCAKVFICFKILNFHNIDLFWCHKSDKTNDNFLHSIFHLIRIFFPIALINIHYSYTVLYVRKIYLNFLSGINKYRFVVVSHPVFTFVADWLAASYHTHLHTIVLYLLVTEVKCTCTGQLITYIDFTF